MEKVVKLGLNALRVYHKEHQVVLCNFPLKTGQVRESASPKDLEDGVHMPIASKLTLHRGEVPAVEHH